jgi:Putative addiction module component
MSASLEIGQMTIEEKLQVMESLWADLCARASVAMPQWHRDTLDYRQRLVDQGKAQFIDWETAKEQIRDRTS